MKILVSVNVWKMLDSGNVGHTCRKSWCRRLCYAGWQKQGYAWYLRLILIDKREQFLKKILKEKGMREKKPKCRIKKKAMGG